MTWSLYGMGEETDKINRNVWLYGHMADNSLDYSPKNKICGFSYGEVASIVACREADKDKRFFSFRETL